MFFVRSVLWLPNARHSGDARDAKRLSLTLSPRRRHHHRGKRFSPPRAVINCVVEPQTLASGLTGWILMDCTPISLPGWIFSGPSCGLHIFPNWWSWKLTTIINTSRRRAGERQRCGGVWLAVLGEYRWVSFEFFVLVFQADVFLGNDRLTLFSYTSFVSLVWLSMLSYICYYFNDAY